ncbi:hypothetical protein MKZ38_008966 [Zalerion maritima]|uniref:60S ribosomal protein L38 n=1 Tax=Zalerion maritima TaxID=339359 RepID=A0AAD5RVB6_9PEZI|nr:hypothetical protein MKZ38_008966 [Zalerion maritima]
MPREITDIRKFLEICHRKDASSARIKKSTKANSTKFKVRCQRHLYTLKLKDSDKADKLKQSMPPGMIHPPYPDSPLPETVALRFNDDCNGALEIREVPKKNKKGTKSV